MIDVCNYGTKNSGKIRTLIAKQCLEKRSKTIKIQSTNLNLLLEIKNDYPRIIRSYCFMMDGDRFIETVTRRVFIPYKMRISDIMLYCVHGIKQIHTFTVKTSTLYPRNPIQYQSKLNATEFD